MDQLEFVEKELSVLIKKLEVQKLGKQIEEISLNSEQLKKKWYRKPQWIAAISPFIIGVFTLIVAWSSGFLQAQSTLNKIQQETFNKTKDSISQIIARYKIVGDSLTSLNVTLAARNRYYDSANKRMTGYLAVLKDSVQTVDQKKKYFSDKFISMQAQNALLIVENYKLRMERLGLTARTSGKISPYITVLDSTIHISDSEINAFIKNFEKEKSRKNK